MESKKRSCCSSTMCCGMPVEKGCFIFAVINAIICCAASLGSIAFLIFMLYTWFVGYSRGPNDMVLVYLFTGIAVGSCIASAMALTFAVVLCVGIRRKNKNFVRAYLIYGIFVVILSVLGCLCYIGIQWYGVGLMMHAFYPLGVCVVYAFLLVLVYQTQGVLSKQTPATHRRLFNPYDA